MFRKGDPGRRGFLKRGPTILKYFLLNVVIHFVISICKYDDNSHTLGEKLSILFL